MDRTEEEVKAVALLDIDMPGTDGLSSAGGIGKMNAQEIQVVDIALPAGRSYRESLEEIRRTWRDSNTSLNP